MKILKYLISISPKGPTFVPQTQLYVHMRGSRGGHGSGHLLKNYKNIVFLIPLFHTGQDSPESPRIDFFIGGGGGGFVRFH